EEAGRRILVRCIGNDVGHDVYARVVHGADVLQQIRVEIADAAAEVEDLLSLQSADLGEPGKAEALSFRTPLSGCWAGAVLLERSAVAVDDAFEGVGVHSVKKDSYERR